MSLRGIWSGLLVGLALVTTGSVTWLATRPPTAGCPGNSDVTGPIVIPARSIVARPWYGPHHVYGLFMVPERFGREKVLATLRVGGFQEPADLRGRRWSAGSVDPLPGYYVKRIYMPTRVALKFLVSGRFRDLRAPCNWTLDVSTRTTRMRPTDSWPRESTGHPTVRDSTGTIFEETIARAVVQRTVSVAGLDLITQVAVDALRAEIARHCELGTGSLVRPAVGSLKASRCPRRKSCTPIFETCTDLIRRRVPPRQHPAHRMATRTRSSPYPHHRAPSPKPVRFTRTPATSRTALTPVTDYV